MISAFCGLVTSAVIVLGAKRSLLRVSPGKTAPRFTAYSLSIIGVVSGIQVLERSVADATILIGVSSLLISQVTIDITAHRLMRFPTVVCTVVVCVALWYRELSGAPIEHSLDDVVYLTACSLFVPAIFGLFSLRRPQDLGRGDVLIAFPLSMAVASVSAWLLPWWLLAASTSGSVHGAVVKCRGERTIPFGPHLLIWAWLLLVVGI